MKVYLKYADISNAAKYISELIDPNVDLIVGIVRGGMVPGYLVAEQMNKPFTTITWQTRDGTTKEVNSAIVEFIETGKKIVFVDDINDSGRTFNDIVACYSKFASDGQLTTAALYAKEGSAHIASIKPFKEFNQHEWVVFPWELSD